jgi:hypothetical protein
MVIQGLKPAHSNAQPVGNAGRINKHMLYDAGK